MVVNQSEVQSENQSESRNRYKKSDSPKKSKTSPETSPKASPKAFQTGQEGSFWRGKLEGGDVRVLLFKVSFKPIRNTV